MKRFLFSVFCFVLLSGCASSLPTGGNIRFGMTREQVLEKIGKDQKIIKSEEDMIISEGYDKLWGMPRQNTFTFRDGKLIQHDNTPVR